MSPSLTGATAPEVVDELVGRAESVNPERVFVFQAASSRGVAIIIPAYAFSSVSREGIYKCVEGALTKYFSGSTFA